MPRRGQSNYKANVWTARIIPVLLLGIVTYSSWVVTSRVCIDYLLRSHPRRHGPAVAILVIFYLLLLAVLITYARLITTVVSNPGVVPRGPQYYVEKEGRARRVSASSEKEGWHDGSCEGYGKLPAKKTHNRHLSTGEDFWHKEVFVCKYDGRPPFCSQCYRYKPSRSHHCSELNRCVLKMDHFCPWIGGVVSETSFKFFILFTFWTLLFTIHVLVVTAYFFAERRRREPGFIADVHWVLVLAFAALFLLFSGGMCISSLQFAFLNTTTIENITRRSHVWYLAVYVPDAVLQRYHASGRSDLRLIAYPRPAAEQLLVLQQQQQQQNNPGSNSRTGGGSSGSPEELPPRGVPTPQPQTLATTDPLPGPRQSTPKAPTASRTFAILETKPGANPFDIGYWNNFKQVMGYTVLDWFLPLRPSPCANHDDPRCMYKTGPVLEQLKMEAGIDIPETAEWRRQQSRTNSLRSSSSSGGGGIHDQQKKRRRKSTSSQPQV